MTLVDRARQLIAGGGPAKLSPLLPAEFSTLLVDCVAAGNRDGLLATQLLSCDMYGGNPYNLSFKAPAAYCLLAWRRDGLQALIENALEKPTSKNVSLAFRLLASTAEGQPSQSVGWFLSDSQVPEAVSRAVSNWDDLRLEARSHLHELVLSLKDDVHASISAGAALTLLAVQDQGAVNNLIHAFALRSIAVGPRILGAYRDLLVAATDEPSFQNFFEEHPLFLDPRAFQVWGRPDFHGKLEPDFIIRTYDGRYVIVEIETPTKLMVTQQRQLSADTSHAISQVLQYQDYLLTHFASATATFPEFTRPSGLVVIGLESSLNVEQKAALRSENLSRSDVRIVGFDALADAANVVTRNVIQGIAGATRGTRLL